MTIHVSVFSDVAMKVEPLRITYLGGGAFTSSEFPDVLIELHSFLSSLPIGAITIATILLFIKPQHSFRLKDDPTPTWRRIVGLDWIGTILCLGMVTSLLLALQWGGVTKPWSDKSVIACLCVVSTQPYS